MERIICSEEEARQFYLSDRAMCPAGDKECYSEKTRSSYSEHSSEELERKWANEEFIRLLPKINPENTQNLPCLKKLRNGTKAISLLICLPKSRN